MSEVDVSKCRYYNKPFCNLYDNYCNDCDACYFKQIQQLKEENEELKKAFKENKNSFNDVCVNLLQKEQKLEKIKSLVIVLKNICPSFIKDGNDSLKVINEILGIIGERK